MRRNHNNNGYTKLRKQELEDYLVRNTMKKMNYHKEKLKTHMKMMIPPKATHYLRDRVKVHMTAHILNYLNQSLLR